MLVAEIRKLFKVLIQNVEQTFFEHVLPSSTDRNSSQSKHCETLIWFVSQRNETYLINSTDKVAI